MESQSIHKHVPVTTSTTDLAFFSTKLSRSAISKTRNSKGVFAPGVVGAAKIQKGNMKEKLEKWNTLW